MFHHRRGGLDHTGDVGQVGRQNHGVIDLGELAELIEIVLGDEIKGPKSHDIGVKVQKSVESLKMVSRAFVHIDYE